MSSTSGHQKESTCILTSYNQTMVISQTATPKRGGLMAQTINQIGLNLTSKKTMKIREDDASTATFTVITYKMDPKTASGSFDSSKMIHGNKMGLTTLKLLILNYMVISISLSKTVKSPQTFHLICLLNQAFFSIH